VDIKRALLLLLPILPTLAQAHALDEYMQHTLISIERDRIEISLRLVPGRQVLPSLLAVIDRDRDGKVSAVEAQAYGARVAGDLRLKLDGKVAEMELAAVEVPQPERLKDGFGAVRLRLAAAAPAGNGVHRLELGNSHLPKFSAYLVNSLAPRDAAIRIGAQQRSIDQSVYRLDYARAGR
jgi:hypothetical protein